MAKIISLFFFIGFAVMGFTQDNIVIYLDGQTSDLSSGNGPYTIMAPSAAVFDVTFDVYNTVTIPVNGE